MGKNTKKKRIKLNDKQKKDIIAKYVELQNYSEVGRLFGISDTAVKKIVDNDAESLEKLEQKKEECITNTLDFMQEQAEAKKRVLGKLLKGIELKADDIKHIDKMNVKDLATAYGIILDKELKFLEIQRNKGNVEEDINNNIMNIADLINNPVSNRSEEDV